MIDKIVSKYMRINEASSKYLQRWVNVIDNIIISMEDEYDTIISGEQEDSGYDMTTFRLLDNYKKEMNIFCRQAEKIAEKIAEIFDRISNTKLKGIPVQIVINTNTNTGIEAIITIGSDADISLTTTFIEELRKNILNIPNINSNYYKNNNNGYLYQNKNTITLILGTNSCKQSLPAKNKLGDFIQNKKSLENYKITF